MTLHFSKGHGTGNDFVLLPDPDGALDLTAEHVRALCDRRFGIGADGVLRVVRTERAAQAPDIDIRAYPGAPEWFMDYRNADGSIAAMCGNGIRVFARYLVDRGWAHSGRLEILTRGGIRVLEVPRAGDIEVDMGAPVFAGFPSQTQVGLDGQMFDAVGLGMPNPHAVVRMPSLTALPELLTSVQLDAATFPQGANVEFVMPLSGPTPAVRMRVLERGSGETLSCGTGACAVGVVVTRDQGLARGTPIAIHLPGGVLQVVHTPANTVHMTGPAVIVADGELRDDWWASGPIAIEEAP